MERKFDVTDHTADIGIAAYGESMAELMANAAYGMVSLMTDSGNIHRKLSKTIELQEVDGVALLVKWLNELLYVFEVEGLLFSSFNIVMHGETSMTAICLGENYDPARHHVEREIKAATYHSLEIAKEMGGYSTRIIFDI